MSKPKMCLFPNREKLQEMIKHSKTILQKSWEAGHYFCFSDFLLFWKDYQKQWDICFTRDFYWFLNDP